jgi:hypothetical protein
MSKSSTVMSNRVEIFKDDKLTIGVDLGDRFSHYCVLNGAGEIIREHRLDLSRLTCRGDRSSSSAALAHVRFPCTQCEMTVTRCNSF